jgi:beta-glucosidase
MRNFTRASVYCIGSLSLLAFAATVISSTIDQPKKWSTEDEGDGIVLVKNQNGPTLGYSSKSGLIILTVDGLAFKDLNRNGKLDKYEDWRLPVAERAKDLSAQMTVEQIAGLMLYSAHQAIPAIAVGYGAGTYGGKHFGEGIDPTDITDQQKTFLLKDNLRHVLITSVQTPEVAARWNNNVQALVEGAGLGIPANNSSDPRHGTSSGVEYTAGAGGKISQWPDQLGLAATFDPNVIKEFGHIAAQEYRALGIATALSPQIDLGSEPRWVRINGTFGEDPQLDADMARAYVDGFQTSDAGAEIKDGWGYHSVNAMMKHWPGGGPEEGGRDAHYAYGKFAVYPGNNFDEHLVSFVDGTLKLDGKTKMAAAVMPYYTISYGRDVKNKENDGNSYSKYLITDLLRTKYHYDGVVCTDWGVTADEGKTPDIFGGKSWGMETKTVAERHYKILMAGVDQFGGNNDAVPVIEAYKMGVKEHGEAAMRARFEQSAVRLLTNIFRVGLFENPYLDIKHTQLTVGNPYFMKAGYEAQLKSIVLLKNSNNVLPLKTGTTVYLPKKYTPSMLGFFGPPSKEHWDDAVTGDLLGKYFKSTDDPSKADCAVVFVSSPYGGAGYDKEDVAKGGTGYTPITLQYGEYTATDARAHSIAAGDPAEPNVNDRTYKGKTITAGNYNDLKTIRETKAAMKGKPVIVVITLSKPAIPAEFEKDANAIVANFGVQNQAILDILSGAAEPSALLPFQMPADMKTVELQNEDIPHDMICYKDADGHTYDFGFGMNWKGVIHDARTEKYVDLIKKPKIEIKGGMVTITCATPGVKIYYTTDGATPAFVEANEYSKPFKLTGSASVKAIAKKYGFDNSSLAETTVRRVMIK